jgi:gamma-glutamyltranspeptidase
MRDFQTPGRSLVYATNGLCATSHPLAAQVAVRMLQNGGNAVDAAIAAAVLLGFCEPAMTGLGGDVFVLVKPAGAERILGLNGSGCAPAGLDAASLRAAGHSTMPEQDAASVTVPGAVDAFVRLAADWGRLGLAACLAPAIRYAEEGVPVAPRVARDWALYITVVDRDRMAVSLIYSIFHDFGSGLASSRFGINFHNRGAGFSLVPGHPNEAGPGKRPLHTIIPAMLRREGRVVMPFGVMGGAYQPAGHVRLISNMLDFGLDAQAAIDAPRSFADGETLALETGYSEAVARDLAARGHRVVRRDKPLGGAQAIVIDGDVLIGASDPRKDGAAIGY